jgi:hypothetical protein
VSTEVAEKPHFNLIYRPEFVEQAERLCRLGATDVDLAEYFDVTKQTIYNWKERFPEFRAAIRLGKFEADMLVTESLYNKALAGDTTACIYWTKNRRPDLWRDKQDVEHSGNVALDVRAIREKVESRVNGIASRLLSSGNGSDG